MLYPPSPWDPRCARGASGLPTADGMGLCGLQSELMLVGVHARLGPPEPMPAEGGGAAVQLIPGIKKAGNAAPGFVSSRFYGR